MAIVCILAGSFVGFLLGMVSLALGSGLTFAMMLWMGVGLLASALSTALTLFKPMPQQEGMTLSA
jgi:hypothetical protein